MVSLVENVERASARHALLKRGESVLVGVSGGVDSMVLLHVLHALRKRNRLRLTVAHFNHQLRGHESDGDQKLVETTARTLGYECRVGSGNVAELSSAKRISTEMAARQLRHAFLAETAREVGARTVALGHHADDQVELFFLRLLRGSGPSGLAGMAWQNPSPADAGVRLIRPLLGCTKEELQHFAEAEGVAFREDRTNSNHDVLRNRVRQELLPLMKQNYQPALTKITLRVMDLLRAEDDLVTAIAKKELARPPGKFALLPLAVQRKYLQLQLIDQGMEPNFDLIETLRESAGVSVSVGADLLVSREGNGRLHLERRNEAHFSTDELLIDLSVRSGSVEFNKLLLKWRITPQVPTLRQTQGCEYFDAGKIGSKVVLRHWRPGDTYQPVGLKGRAKLQDLFVNHKILRSKRHHSVVATTRDGEIFWVEGMRISERFKLDNQTLRRLKWSWQRTESA